MFRNPRENLALAGNSKVAPSVGRPPSPPAVPLDTTGRRFIRQSVQAPMATKTPASRSATMPAPKPTKTPKKAPVVANGRTKPKPDGSILNFFKKAEHVEPGLFTEARAGEESSRFFEKEDGAEAEEVAWLGEHGLDGDRFHEQGGSVKRRRIDIGDERVVDGAVPTAGSGAEAEAIISYRACTPPPPDLADRSAQMPSDGLAPDGSKEASRPARKVGPFLDDSDSDDDTPDLPRAKAPMSTDMKIDLNPAKTASNKLKNEPEEDLQDSIVQQVPQLRREGTSHTAADGFGDFSEEEDFDDEFVEGEEYVERRWMEEQRRLEMEEGEFEGELAKYEEGDSFEAQVTPPEAELSEAGSGGEAAMSSCPICSISLEGVSDQDASVHVNNCLDGNPSPLPARATSTSKTPDSGKANPPENRVTNKSENGGRFKKTTRPPKPGQENPFVLGSASAIPTSAFSKLMSGHAEDAAWATAAAAEHAARGKPAYQRTCPFYKILPGFFICVDAFRYGAVQGCQAYFLSHFHSDHYVGLTASWCHGPIYCSRVTANLVRQQLRVDKRWVIDLEWEKKVEVPGTDSVHVTMLPANHCPGSSIYLFEKVIGKGKSPKIQRVLHCGDFRACRAHVGHPLLKPEVKDAVTGTLGQQKIDVCYLDTTYLDSKYAFPSQEEVIQACADMCVSLNKVRTDESDGWEQMKRGRAGEGMAKFLREGSDVVKKEEDEEDADNLDTMKVATQSSKKTRGRLLVVVGTYSIGKERICLGIARALKSKIYAPPGKQRICAALEEPELNARLTSDPREAQVHMTPLFEIRAETLDDYLKDYRDTFSRAVGFRPSGWNYRPPNSRFVESPSVQTVLHSANWKSTYSMRELMPQRGSTSRASCFGVPYSEHSSFRELTMFCCALKIDKIIPTVNVGSAKSREKMKGWCDKWAVDRKKNGLYKWEEGITEWHVL